MFFFCLTLCWGLWGTPLVFYWSAHSCGVDYGVIFNWSVKCKQCDWWSVWSVFLHRSIRSCSSQRRRIAESCCTDSCHTCHCPPTRYPNTPHTNTRQRSFLQILPYHSESSNVCWHCDCAEPPAVAADVWDVHESEFGWKGVFCPRLRAWRLSGIDAF